MSQDYFAQSGASSSRSDESESRQYARPNYMTVGSGSISDNAQRLTEMLDNDSGYGSRIGEDVEMPSGDLQQSANAQMFQLHYNDNRNALGNAISRTIETLKDLQTENTRWPVHYPSVQATVEESRPSLGHTQSSPVVSRRKFRPHAQRADTALSYSFDEPLEEEPAEPRLVTPQLARDFSVLKIDLKMDGLPQTDILHSMRKDSKALARLLDGQIVKSLKHLWLLRNRIEDTSSKVLITGDLNSGKSTFCNALLRRKILPEDEQPCTSIFCEVLDFRENNNVEEVHAIPIGAVYDRNNEASYVPFAVEELDQIVVANDQYSQCKVYIRDIRSTEESLLNNGIMDIALIDAPGLNSDSLKTTAVFARQEEIDVVVFVVSAANHFTISARDFIFNAAQEKAYMFIVVNGFDSIKNKQRCQEQILKQVAHMSPATFKESSELVHFVSSSSVPTGPEDPGDPDDDDKGKGKQAENMHDFAALETSLRRFVLEKRARSKLAPARTYLLNVLDDLQNLAQVNEEVAQSELDRVTKQLEELEPLLEDSRRARNEIRDQLDKVTETCSSDVYSYTRDLLNNTIADVSNRDLGVAYTSIWEAYSYGEDIAAAIVSEVSVSVDLCEDFARSKTSDGVDTIKKAGVKHLGDNYTDLQFQPDYMLRRRKDALARRIHVNIEVWDFFDLSSIWAKQDSMAGTSVAVTVAGVVGTQVVRGFGWVDGAVGAARILGADNLRRLVIPCLLTAAAVAISYAVSSIPTTLPRRLAAKIADELAAIDFTNSNSLRISTEVRKALKIPAENLRIGLQRKFEDFQNRREETGKVRSESEVARKYFSNLVRSTDDIRQSVHRIDLEVHHS